MEQRIFVETKNHVRKSFITETLAYCSYEEKKKGTQKSSLLIICLLPFLFNDLIYYITIFVETKMKNI